MTRPLVVTAGEPAGIGPDLCIALSAANVEHDFVAVSDPDLLRARAALLGANIEITEISQELVGERVAQPGELLVLPVRFPAEPVCGALDTANSQALLDGLALAVEGCLAGRFSGVVTAPLQKSVINDAGIPFTGHTEFLAELTGTQRPVMMLVAGNLRVALASTHLPLREVPDYLTSEGIREVLELSLIHISEPTRR